MSAFHALTADLGLALPWPKPEEFVPAQQDEYILIWGGSSSVGQFALQILKYYGYRNLLSTSSKRNHGLLREFGATDVFDYTEPDVVEKILEGRKVGLILDCIGSSQGSVKPVSQIATAGTTVAILLPVIVKDATETEAPEYAMDVAAAAPWAKGVDVRGVRTHFYLDVSLNVIENEILSRAYWFSESIGADKGFVSMFRIPSSRSICSQPSCPLCWRRGLSSRISRRLWKVRRCLKERREHWTLCDLRV